MACHIFQVEENNSVVDFYFNDMPRTLLPQHSQATVQTRSDVTVYTGMFEKDSTVH